jgi:16S rRNA (guanine527-N7)-methyltransferase
MLPRGAAPGAFRSALLSGARAAGRPLTEREAAALETHYRLLRHWNRRINLTGLRDEEAILRRHFLEPIAAAGLVGDRGVLLDLGSGNGFPAVPLKVLHPGLELVLVESSEKKSAFLREVLRELGLEGARVETRRIRRRADLADLLPCAYLTIRAVRVRDLIGGEGVKILAPGGRALLFVASREAEALRRQGIAGLCFIESRRLPSGPNSILVVMGEADSSS